MSGSPMDILQLQTEENADVPSISLSQAAFLSITKVQANKQNQTGLHQSFKNARWKWHRGGKKCPETETNAANHLSDTCLVSRMYKELSQLHK